MENIHTNSETASGTDRINTNSYITKYFNSVFFFSFGASISVEAAGIQILEITNACAYTFSELTCQH